MAIKIKEFRGKEYKEMDADEDCFRLVHDGSKVLHIFEADGITATKHELFIGTKAECLTEIKSKGLASGEVEIHFKPVGQEMPVKEILKDALKD